MAQTLSYKVSDAATGVSVTVMRDWSLFEFIVQGYQNGIANDDLYYIEESLDDAITTAHRIIEGDAP